MCLYGYLEENKDIFEVTAPNIQGKKYTVDEELFKEKYELYKDMLGKFTYVLRVCRCIEMEAYDDEEWQ